MTHTPLTGTALGGFYLSWLFPTQWDAFWATCSYDLEEGFRMFYVEQLGKERLQ